MIDTNSLLNKLKEEAVTINIDAAKCSTLVTPKVTRRADTESKADRQNIARQAAIGAKKDTATGISKHGETDVADSVLQEVDGNKKKVGWQLQEIITKMIAAADCPATTSILDALIKRL